MTTVGRIIHVAEKIMTKKFFQKVFIHIDDDGVGGRVKDRLREVVREKRITAKIFDCHNGGSADDKEHYSNWATENWFRLKDRFIDFAGNFFVLSKSILKNFFGGDFMIPLILAATAAVGGTGLFFMKKGVDSEKTFSDAKKIDENSRKLVEKLEENLNEIQIKTQESFENLIETKSDVLDVNIKIFLENFSKIKKINYEELNFDRNDLIELQSESFQSRKKLNLDEIFKNSDEVLYTLKEVNTETDLPKWIKSITEPENKNNKSFLSSFLSAEKKSTKMSKAFGRNRTTSDVQNALLINAIGLFAVGAIKFTGHAAKGYLLNSKSNEALKNANENFTSIKIFEEHTKKFSSILNEFYNLSEETNLLLLNFNENFSDEIENLENVICKSGRNWKNYSDKDKQVVKKNADIAKNIKDTLVNFDRTFEEIYLKIYKS